MKQFLILTVLFLLTAPAFAQQDTFTFNPPDSLAFRSTLVGERFRILNDQKSPVDSNFITTRETLRKVDDGYTIMMDAEHFETKRAGQKLDNPVLDAFAAVDVTLHLDSTGQAQSVTGFENIIPYIQSHSDSATAASVRQMLDPSLLELRQLDEWNSRIGRLTALKLDFAYRAYDQGNYPLPDGTTLDLFSSFRVIDTSQIAGRLTLRIAIDSDSNPLKLGESTGTDSATIAKQFQLTDARMAAFSELPIRSFTHIELIVDAGTLMVRQEASMSTLSVNINDPQAGPQKMKIIDRRTIDYDYPDWK